MTLLEVCNILGKSETTLITSLKRTQINLAKKGIILIKEGKGKTANYIIKYREDNKDGTSNN